MTFKYSRPAVEPGGGGRGGWKRRVELGEEETVCLSPSSFTLAVCLSVFQSKHPFIHRSVSVAVSLALSLSFSLLPFWFSLPPFPLSSFLFASVPSPPISFSWLSVWRRQTCAGQSIKFFVNLHSLPFPSLTAFTCPLFLLYSSLPLPHSTCVWLFLSIYLFANDVSTLIFFFFTVACCPWMNLFLCSFPVIAKKY